MKLEQMTMEEIYLEFYCNFLTIERMAEYYNVPTELLKMWIDCGRAINHGQNWEEFQNNINELYYSLI